MRGIRGGHVVLRRVLRARELPLFYIPYANIYVTRAARDVSDEIRRDDLCARGVHVFGVIIVMVIKLFCTSFWSKCGWVLILRIRVI